MWKNLGRKHIYNKRRNNTTHIQLFVKFLSTPLFDREKIEEIAKWCIHPHRLLWLPFGLLSTLLSFIWPHDYYCPEVIDFLELDTSRATRSMHRVGCLYTQFTRFIRTQNTTELHTRMSGYVPEKQARTLGRLMSDGLREGMFSEYIVCRDKGILSTCISPDHDGSPDVLMVCIGLNQIYLCKYCNERKETWKACLAQ